MKAAFAAVLCLLASAPCAAEEILYFKSERAQNTLVELYTSDTNGSCEPALRWMSTLKTKNGLWKTFVPLAMHVSYWDEYGNKDAFAQKIFDDFLLRYKQLWKVSRAYAPTVVANGTEWGGWSHDQDIPKALPKDAGLLSADGRKRVDHFLVEFIPPKKITADGVTVHAALLGFGVDRGKGLAHDFVALAYKEQSFHLSYGVLTTDFELSKRKAPKAKKYAVVFWITPGRNIRPMQATGGYLP